MSAFAPDYDTNVAKCPKVEVAAASRRHMSFKQTTSSQQWHREGSAGGGGKGPPTFRAGGHSPHFQSFEMSYVMMNLCNWKQQLKGALQATNLPISELLATTS